jgi:dynein heavy chain
LNALPTQALFEMYFAFAAIWAFGGALVEKDGIDYRRKFDKWWKATWTSVKMPGAHLGGWFGDKWPTKL